MKKIILMAISLVLLTSVACASPFLCCDPSPDIITGTQIEVTFQGATTLYSGIYNVVGPDAQILDLTGFPNGSYKFRVRWWCEGGWVSDWSDEKTFVKSGKPGNFRIK